MAQLKDLIVNGPARVINDLYVNGTIYESGSSLAVKYAPATHTHAASDITSGTFPASLLPADVEYTSRMVTSVTSSATDTTYPSAKAVYNSLTKVNRIFRGTCATAAATAAKSVTCAEYDALTIGDVIFVVFSYANSAAGSSLTLSVNGTTAKQVRVQIGSLERIPDNAQFKANFPYMFVYDGTFWTTVSNTDLTIGALSTQQLVSDGGSLYRWMIVLSDRDGALIPFSNGNNQPTTYTKTVTTHTFNPFGKIAFYNDSTTVAASGTIPASKVLYSHSFSAQYSINVATSGTAGTTAFAARKPVYIKAKYNASTGLATLAPGTDTTNYLAYSSVTQTLPSANPNTGLNSNEEYIYIYLGSTDSTAYMMAMDPFHPVYHWDSTHGCMAAFGGSGGGGGSIAMTVLDYGTSTWNDFITAYNNHAIVYCAVDGSSSYPGSKCLAFMAYYNPSDSNSTQSVEFQYVRSVGSLNSSNPSDQVFIYKLTSTGTWTTTTRSLHGKVTAGANITVTPSGDSIQIAASVGSHTHGDINNSGQITTSTAVNVNTNDAILIADASASNALVKSSLTFQPQNTTFKHDFLTRYGTWEYLDICFGLDYYLSSQTTVIIDNVAQLDQGEVDDILSRFVENHYVYLYDDGNKFSGNNGNLYSATNINQSNSHYYATFTTLISDDGFYGVLTLNGSDDTITYTECLLMKDSYRSTSSTGLIQNSTITQWTQKLIAPVNYTVGASAAPAALVAAPPAGFIVGDQFVSADGWLGTVTTDMGAMGASVNFNTLWLAPHKLTVNSTQYTVSRKALTIVDGSTTTTYYVADLTT